jgi:hypothetical protein
VGDLHRIPVTVATTVVVKIAERADGSRRDRSGVVRIRVGMGGNSIDSATKRGGTMPSPFGPRPR